jgi:hypothetical protein
MRYLRVTTLFAGSLSVALVNVLVAQSPATSIENWTVPAYARPSSGLSAMTDVSPGVGFVAAAPCRLVDTRSGSGFPAGYGPPWLSAGVPRNFDLNSSPTCPGIPDGVDAYSLNVTVTNTQGPGFLLIYPEGGSQPNVSSINYLAGDTLANAVIVPAGTGGSIRIVAGVSGTDVIIDINGYFTDSYNSGVSFRAIGNVPGGPSPGSGVIFGHNTNTATNYSNGAAFFSDSCGYASAGVVGQDLSFGGPGCGPVFGVWGIAGSGEAGSSGVYGWQMAPIGEVFGVTGITNSESDDTAGVWAYSSPTSGRTYGVIGESNGSSRGAAGVLGIDVTGTTASASGPGGTLGIRGDSRFGTGILGLSEDHDGGQRAVSGQLVHFSTGLPVASGHLGYDAGDNNYAVFAAGDYGGSGAKYFVEPHPVDASKVIRYVALEGPEAGTYFRGKGRFQNGVATIDVPEDFRLVTDPDSLSVVATPIGDMAVIAVSRVALDRIVLRGSRNVEFFYLVNGVRKTHKDLTPIVAGREFAPQSADAKMPSHLTEGQKRILIANGTYNADGTVNLQTARRLGWDRIWEERARPRPEPASSGIDLPKR